MQVDQGDPILRKKDEEFFLHDLLTTFATFWEKIWALPFLWIAEKRGERAEVELEPLARWAGNFIGEWLRPFFRKNTQHALEPALFVTRFVENATNIKGEDLYLSENLVIRRVYQCPFKDKPRARILCHLGEAIGQELFAKIVPQSQHKVHQTMARGSSYCEYSYSLEPSSQQGHDPSK
ncbi:MAG: hypothetical protein NZM25_02990 [Leptospiraceae bacterium]|nr:hypothetical protein [Leptospiraceae bacterium]MDW8307235.1 hypothetical protein [Leptospiraceae bacterium]